MALGSLVATASAFTSNEANIVKTPKLYNQSVAYVVATQSISPREYLKQLAGPDFALLNRIIFCESGWNPVAQNSHSTAGGLFQFLDSTWASTASPGWEKYNPYDNIRAGIKLYIVRGTSPWLASQACWS